MNPDCELPGDASPGQPASLRTKRIRIGQIEVDGYRLGAAVDAIEALVRSGQGGLVVTPNVDHVVIAERNVEFRDAYAGAALSLADGMPLLWAARILGTPLPEKVSGSDLVMPLAERAAARRWRVFLLGASPGVAEEAGRRLHQQLGVDVVGADAPMTASTGSPTRPHRPLTVFVRPVPTCCCWPSAPRSRRSGDTATEWRSVQPSS